MEVPWAWIAATVAVIFLTGVYFTWWTEPLEWERGRRKACQPYRKDSFYYAKHGVQVREEFLINSRGIELFTKHWLPLSGPLRGVILYCHGYGDHCNWFFEDVAMQLAASQYAVVSMDYEGHGQSQGLQAYIRNFDTIVDDVIEFAHLLRDKAEFQSLPFFLYGESMGGAVALKVHRRQPYAWDGAVLVAPMCKISDDVQPPAAVVAVLKVLARVVPTWKLVPTRDICEITFRVPEKRQKGYENPAAYKGKPRLGTALQLLNATDEIGAHLHEVSLPLLILHGGDDMVTDPAVSKALHASAESTDKTLRLYEGSWHALIAGEPDEVVKVVLNDIISWLDRRSLPLGVHPSGKSGHMSPLGGYSEDEGSTVTA